MFTSVIKRRKNDTMVIESDDDDVEDLVPADSWYEFPVPDGLKNWVFLDIVIARIREWWTADSGALHWGLVECVNGMIPDHADHMDPDTNLYMDEARLASYNDQDHPCMLFYIVKDGMVMVLGALTFPAVSIMVRHHGVLTVGHLMQTKELDVSGFVNLGTRSPNECWWRLPLVPPGADCDMEVHSTAIGTRLDFLFELWALTKGTSPEQIDACLLAMHEGCGQQTPALFDLTTDEGRNHEWAVYWATMMVCSFDTRMWPIWEHGEHMLMEWRVRVYFCREHHFLKCLVNNKLLGRFGGGSNTPPDKREEMLYRRRNPGGALPGLWLNVPMKDIPSLIGNPAYDVDKGHMIITYREFGLWAWSKILRLARDVMKHHNANREDFSRSVLDKDFRSAMVFQDHTARITRAMTSMEEADRERRQGARKRTIGPDGTVVEGTAIGSIEQLRITAAAHFPLCMARHVWAADIKSSRPRNLSRVSFVSFLLGAGYTSSEVQDAVFVLYQQDTGYSGQFPHGWTRDAFYKVYGKEIPQMQERIQQERTGPFGCTKLLEAGATSKSHGCPYAKPGGEARAILGWMGTPAQDIEDIMKPTKLPQEMCCLAYRRTREPAIVVRHPNQFAEKSMHTKTQKNSEKIE